VARVAKVHADGSYDVAFSHGEKITRAPPDTLRRLGAV
jgi:hypothetical protein